MGALRMRSGDWTLRILVCTVTLGLTAARAEDPFSDAPRSIEVRAGGQRLTVTVPDMEDLEVEREDENGQRRWWARGRLGDRVLQVSLWVYDRSDKWGTEPEAVLDYVESVWQDPKRNGDPAFTLPDRSVLSGDYGWAPCLVWAAGPSPSTWKCGGDTAVACGLLESKAYALEMICLPGLDDQTRAAIVEMLDHGIETDAKPRDPRWTKAEAQARWDRDAPTETVRAKGRPPIRTKHYIILTNASSGKLFAKKMEANYETIREYFAFEDREDMRLMPVFLFRSDDEYDAYDLKITGTSGNSAGHAWRDYYATYYASPNDPVHIHEATHQIFSNRLYLSGGGSWFQEGVAEYVERKCNDWNAVRAYAKRAAREGSYVPFREFFGLRRLNSASSQEARDRYLQAASLIAFLRENKAMSAHFPTFIREVGRIPRGNVRSIEAKLEQIYGLEADGMEEAWREYWR